MSIVLEPSPPRASEHTSEQVYDWLRREAERRGIKATFFTNAAQEQNGYLHLPVYIGGERGAIDFVKQLQDLEDAWNEQKPRPSPRLWLLPGAAPRG